MCHYCGCRQIPLIRDYIAEHELVTWLGVRALEETGRGEMTKAQATVTQMRSELLTHWQGEEEGVFALMRDDELYREHIDPLIAEHREWFRSTLEQLATAARLEDPVEVAASLVLLRDAALVGGYLDGDARVAPAFERTARSVIAAHRP